MDEELNDDVILTAPVQTVKEELAIIEAAAQEGTPEGMEFLGWCLDGVVMTYPLISKLARPVYAYPREF